MVFEDDGKIKGHIAYSPMKDENGNIIGLALGPVGVLPSYQGEKIGSQLITEANKKAYDKGYDTIFVLCDPKYYTRFGFKLAKSMNWATKLDPAGEHFMVITKKPAPVNKQNVEYCSAFERGMQRVPGKAE